MKRKTAILLAVLVLVGTLVGCTQTPIEKAQDKVVEIGRQYLDFEITAEEAVEKLDSIYDSVPEAENEHGKSRLLGDIGNLRQELNPYYGSMSYERIAEIVDKIENSDYNE